ncbi:hypothetical protein BGZ61DRAFT_374660, partial [Ilyonectria robusta]|uniref:uncharacterized protein n=1 Tax=Ilyonectria robusta TaxID=1079257 RepID=UPI001E8CA8BB
DRLWLQDDLPTDLPSARVFIYEYDSIPVLTSTKTRLTHEASDLLYCLDVDRFDCPERPIIFIAHSLGGILVKQVVYCFLRLSNQSDTHRRSRGLAFFATPHGGGNETLVSFGKKCAAVVNFVTMSAPNDLMEAVTSGSLYSDILQEGWRHQLNNYRIVSFYEGIGNIVPRDSAVLDMPGDIETQVKIEANHGDICRFDTRDLSDSQRYKKVRHGLRKLHEAALNNSPDTPLPTLSRGG